ncbi:MAG: hypothetical protein HN350_02495 [Phycisphaerales bacterium]|nr:hypothetical protein [Phycisphaerales bacterium]
MMPKKLSVQARIAVTLLLCGVCTPAVMGQDLIKALPRPGDREFVRDLAGMLSPADKQKIKEIGDELMFDKATPIIVVTIKSMSDHGGRGMRIETFARLLFDQWEIGVAELNGSVWNTGILLLISEGDRKARIELGAGWGHQRDNVCAQIMEDLIIPEFKDGDFPGGILAGVGALDKMARDMEIPKRPRPMWHYLAVVGFIGLAIFTAVSLYKRGSSGWAWLLWGVVFTVVGMILYTALTSRGGGGGGGGGSFSGGSSGGGGATGSW